MVNKREGAICHGLEISWHILFKIYSTAELTVNKREAAICHGFEISWHIHFKIYASHVQSRKFFLVRIVVLSEQGVRQFLTLRQATTQQQLKGSTIHAKI